MSPVPFAIPPPTFKANCPALVDAARPARFFTPPIAVPAIVFCSAQQSLSKAHSLLAHVPYKAAKLCTGNFLADPLSNADRVLNKVCPRQIFCRPCNSGSVLPYRTVFQQSDYSAGSLCLLNAAKQRTRCLCHPSRCLCSKQLFAVLHSKDATKDGVLHSLPEARIAARRNSAVCQLCSKFCSLPQIASFSCARHALLYKPHRLAAPLANFVALDTTCRICGANRIPAHAVPIPAMVVATLSPLFSRYSITCLHVLQYPAERRGGHSAFRCQTRLHLSAPEGNYFQPQCGRPAMRSQASSIQIQRFRISA